MEGWFDRVPQDTPDTWLSSACAFPLPYPRIPLWLGVCLYRPRSILGLVSLPPSYPPLRCIQNDVRVGKP